MINRFQFCFNFAFKFNLRRYNVVRIPAGVMTVNITAVASQATSHIQLYTLGTAGVNYPGGLPGYTTGKSLTVRRCRLTLSNPR